MIATVWQHMGIFSGCFVVHLAVTENREKKQLLGVNADLNKTIHQLTANNTDLRREIDSLWTKFCGKYFIFCHIFFH